uniref:UBP-type domain-containing protein n=1 Tax=Kalanchoe fedtschenkoi TaxID=63787 RepID=A0A7N0TMS2_KALFE
MSNEAPPPSSSRSVTLELEVGSGDEDELLYGGGWGWVEARTHCDHLESVAADLAHIPTPDTHCSRCQHPDENWLCLCCKDVFCSRFVNKHMVDHNQATSHSLAFSFSDLSVWCYACDAYLDAQVMKQLRPAYETAYLLKFGQAPPFRAAQNPGVIGSSSSS